MESSSSYSNKVVAQLQNLREKIKRKEDEVKQLWLINSNSLISDIEKVKSEVENIKCRTNVSATVLSDYQCKFESMKKMMRCKKDEEIKIQTMVNEINYGIQEIKEEIEQVSVERDEKRIQRDELKDDLWLKKQNLEAMQLTVRAMRLESEAYGISAAEADSLLNNLISGTVDSDNMVSLTHEEYRALTKTAMEEASLSEWQILVSIEQKNAAEKSRDNIARELARLKSKDRSSKRETETICSISIPVDSKTHTETEAETNTEKVEILDMKRQSKISKCCSSSSKNKKYQSSPKRKEGSILTKMRLCLVNKSKYCFRGIQFCNFKRWISRNPHSVNEVISLLKSQYSRHSWSSFYDQPEAKITLSHF